MKNPLNLFKSYFLWRLLGIIGLVCLIWFFGAEIAISGIKPLGSEKIRLMICIGIVVVWLGKILFSHWREVRRNAALLKEIQANREPILKKSVAQTPLSIQFAELDKVLKNSKLLQNKLGWFNANHHVYQLPWFVVLGSDGSGKTTALKHSGLNFPLSSLSIEHQKVLPVTRDCDWFLTDDAVLLDTAGRLSLHATQSHSKDTQDWTEFLSLLKQYRPKQPVNGVVITIGVDELLGDEAKLQELAVAIKKRAQEMHSQFNIDFPIYLTITKLDLLNGFQAFFQHLTEQERQEYLGIHFDKVNAEQSFQTTQTGLAQMVEMFRNLSLGIVSNLSTPTERAAAFIFPDEFERLSRAVVAFLTTLSKQSKFEESIKWRGIYFSSAVQKNEQLLVTSSDLYTDFQLNKKFNQAEKQNHLKSQTSLFLKNLFTDLIFNEANLAGQNKAWFARQRVVYWLSIAAITLLSVTALTLLFISYANNRAYLSGVKNRAEQLSYEIKNTKGLNFKNSIDFANRVQNVVQDSDIKDLNNPPLSYGVGLYQGQQMQKIGQDVYNRLLRDGAMPLVSQNLDDLLRNAQDGDRQFTYNALKAYLMMFDKEHFNQEFMQQWLVANLFNGETTEINQVQKEAAQKALTQVLSQPNLVFSVAYDEELVEMRRQELARVDITSVILEQTLREVLQKKSELPAVSFSSLGGVQSHLLFRRKSGMALKEPIDAIYTKEAYVKWVLPKLIQNTATSFEESSWVLRGYASNVGQTEEAIRQEIQRQYFQNYIKAWNNYLADLTLITPKSARENIQIAKLLSDKNSPLVNIIKGISENTTLNLSKQLQAEQNNVVKDWLSKTGLDINQFIELTDDNGKSGQLTKWVQDTPVDDAFTSFHALVQSEKEQPPTINGVVDAINDLYVYLIAVNVAVEKGVDLPPDDPFVKYKAEIGRLPSPFREMLDNFSTTILDKTDKVVDERLMQSLTKQLMPIAQQCEDMMAQGYPFQSTATNDVAMESFVNVFGENGIYQKFDQLTGQTASLAKVDSLETLMARNETFAERFSPLNNIQTIRRIYFNKGSDSPKFDFTLKVALLDSELESVRITYDGKSQVYSHGPIVAMNLTWPANNPQMKLDISSPTINGSGMSTTGVWSIFRLIEKGKIMRQTANTTLVEYIIKGKKVVLEFTTSLPKNPFNLNHLRTFQCVK